MSFRLAWTGEVGARDVLARQLKEFGVVVTDSVTPQTQAVAVGPGAKLGKLSEAQLYNVPQVTPDWLADFAKSGKVPSTEQYLVTVERVSKSSAESRRCSTDPTFRKRLHRSIVQNAAMESHMERTRPSKRAKLQRSISTNAASPTSASASSSPQLGSGHIHHKRPAHDSSHIRYASTEEPGSVIALEGLIGIGKSTLCNKLLQIYPDSVDVYREETNEKFLQLFYSDTNRYGFALQWGMLKSRIYQLRLAQHDTKHGRWPHRDLLFWDRSMIGDYIFALWNHLCGGISLQEMEAYESEFGGSVRQIDRIPFLNDIQLFVLMNDEPARCKTRVEVNRKNASEQGIPLAYYEGLDDIHFHVFIELLRHRVAKVVVQPWGEYDEAESCRELYENAIFERVPSPSVLDEPSGLNVSSLRSTDPSVLIYRNDDEILKQYQLLSSAHTVAIDDLKNYREIYVPRDVLIIPPEKKGVNLTHLAPYNIKFYENAYKRVVLFHLGHNQNIHFYDSHSL